MEKHSHAYGDHYNQFNSKNDRHSEASDQQRRIYKKAAKLRVRSRTRANSPQASIRKIFRKDSYFVLKMSIQQEYKLKNVH